ncbi:MAG: RNA polymerase sigma factor [Candidatus Aminicenantes bacterium]|nr:MAG: RNA polymerase sigma factor [Candidatus Aminicenantes bacterium]
MSNDNADLIKKACLGDLVAYQEFIRLYSPRVHAIAYQMVGNSIDAQDIAQEVFVRLYRSLRTYKRRFTFTTWLYRLTVNLSIDYLRKHSRHKSISLENALDESMLKDSAPSPDRSLEMNELKGAIQQISEGLTWKQRQVFVLRELQGFSTDEIAQILKCRVSTVRVHLSKARRHIKNALVKHDLSRRSGLISQEGK